MKNWLLGLFHIDVASWRPAAFLGTLILTLPNFVDSLNQQAGTHWVIPTWLMTLLGMVAMSLKTQKPL